MGVRGQSSWLAQLGVHAERADVACVGFQREVANKPHAPRPFHLCPFPKGPGPHGDGSPYWYGMGQAGNLMPPFRASPIRRIRSDAFWALVAVFRFTPAASYMR